jgi:hypothetical protein
VLDDAGNVNETANILETQAQMAAFTIAHPLPYYALQGKESILLAFKELQ